MSASSFASSISCKSTITLATSSGDNSPSPRHTGQHVSWISRGVIQGCLLRCQVVLARYSARQGTAYGSVSPQLTQYTCPSHGDSCVSSCAHAACLAFASAKRRAMFSACCARSRVFSGSGGFLLNGHMIDPFAR
jgi:hypothetical protein